jgi:signal transduction histidine kinase
MLTITTKIIFAYTVVFGLMISLFALMIYQDIKTAEITKLDALLESHADKLSTELEEDSDEPVFPDAASLHALRTEGLSEVRFGLLDRTGKQVISDSGFSGNVAMNGNNALPGVPQKIMLQIAGREYRCLVSPVEIKNQVPFVLQVAAPMSGVEASLLRLRFLFFTSIPVALLLTALTAYVITRIAFRPMMGMAETARLITAKNLHHRLSLPTARDEVRLLGETFNDMIDRIDIAFNSQKQFIADASHEIRTPLTVIYTELEYAEKRAEDQALKESIQISLSEIDRLARLADDLLLLAKLDASQLNLDLQPVRLDELLLECIQRLRNVAVKKQIDIRVDVQDAIEFLGDKDKLKSIFLNLLDNAVKYSNEHGVVTASLYFNNAQRENVVICIADQGFGIPVAEIPNIFKRFYRVDQSRNDTPGSGLGLAIVERLIELHGGNISVESREGKGSMFYVTLPMKMSS